MSNAANGSKFSESTRLEARKVQQMGEKRIELRDAVCAGEMSDLEANEALLSYSDRLDAEIDAVRAAEFLGVAA
jgi:hypothetical protein